MLFANIRRLTPDIIKKSPVTFDIIWSTETNMFIQLNPKKPSYTDNIWIDIPDYDKEANPHLLVSNKNKLSNYKILHAYR